MPDQPSNIRFDRDTTPGVVRVSYVRSPETPRDEAAILQDPLDLWGVAWALENDAPRVIDVRPPRGLSRAWWRTLVLRLEGLQDLVDGFEFRMDGTRTFLQEAARIRDEMRKGLLFTYDRANLRRGEEANRAPAETPIGAWIEQNAKRFLGGAFPHGLRRNFPATAFKSYLEEKFRATAKFRIDVLAVDEQDRLSALAIDAGEGLGLLARGLDAAMYCRAFLPHLRRNWFPEATGERVAVYLVSDRFHPALLKQGDDPRRAVSEALHPSAGLDLVFVQVDPAGLPKALAERVVFPPVLPEPSLPSDADGGAA